MKIKSGPPLLPVVVETSQVEESPAVDRFESITPVAKSPMAIPRELPLAGVKSVAACIFADFKDMQELLKLKIGGKKSAIDIIRAFPAAVFAEFEKSPTSLSFMTRRAVQNGRLKSLARQMDPASMNELNGFATEWLRQIGDFGVDRALVLRELQDPTDVGKGQVLVNQSVHAYLAQQSTAGEPTTLLVGCGHGTGGTLEDESDHHHEKAYTVDRSPIHSDRSQASGSDFANHPLMPDLMGDFDDAEVASYLPDVSFDQAYLELVTPETLRRPETFATMARTLKPGGHLYLDMYSNEISDKENAESFYHKTRERAFAAGFENFEEIRGDNPFNKRKAGDWHGALIRVTKPFLKDI